MKNLGYGYDEIIFLDFVEYISTHVDAKTLTKELQQNRYNHIENLRKNKIEEIKKVLILILHMKINYKDQARTYR